MSWRDWFKGDPIAEELESHLRMAIAERVARGESPADAERNARRELGNLTHVSEVTREQRQGAFILLERLGQELRVAIRSLVKSRSFTIGTIGCWAIAIAAHGAMLAIVDQVFARPPAHVWDASRVVRLYRRLEYPQRPAATTPNFSFMAADALRRDAGRVGEFAAYSAFEATAELPGGVRTLRASAITRNYFNLLGVRPALGILPADGMPTLDSCAEGMVISHALWSSALGGESSAIGTTIRINQRSLPVCAVAPDGFTGGDPSNPEAWIPIEVAGAWARGDNWREARAGGFHVVARRHWFANAEDLAAVSKELVKPFETTRASATSVIAASLVPGRAPDGVEQNRTILWLGGAATLLLLLATLNVSTMLLLRTLERQPELALRRMLGASGGTLARNVAIELMTIGVAGAAAGLFLAHLLRPVMQQLLGVDAIPIPLDRIVAIEGTLLLAACALASLPSALAAVSARSPFEYRANPRSTASARTGHVRGALLALQIASCVVLVAGALTMGASLEAVRALDLGLDTERVLTIEIGSQFVRAQGVEQTRATMRELEQRAAALPGVTATAVTLRLPFVGLSAVATFNESRELIRMPTGAIPFYTSATHGYLKAIGARMLSGRDFTAADDASTDRVAIVNATFASSVYPGSNAIGRCIYLGDPKYGPCHRIVGVIADQRRASILPEEGMLEIYIPLAQDRFGPQRFIALRTSEDPSRLLPAVERLAKATLPAGAPITVAPLSRQLDPQVRPWIAATRLLGMYSFVAFIVATAGIVGTLAYLTRLARRTTAIRIALGATQLRATMSVARTGIGITLVGLAIGGVAALALRDRAGTLVFGIERVDLAALVLQAVTLVGLAGAIASFVPAWRGARPTIFRSLNAE